MIFNHLKWNWSQIVKLQKLFPMISNSTRFPENWISKMPFLNFCVGVWVGLSNSTSFGTNLMAAVGFLVLRFNLWLNYLNASSWLQFKDLLFRYFDSFFEKTIDSLSWIFIIRLNYLYYGLSRLTIVEFKVNSFLLPWLKKIFSRKG